MGILLSLMVVGWERCLRLFRVTEWRRKVVLSSVIGCNVWCLAGVKLAVEEQKWLCSSAC